MTSSVRAASLTPCAVPSNRLLDEFRRRTFVLVSRAFACLYVAEAQRLLGLGRKEVLSGELDVSRIDVMPLY